MHGPETDVNGEIRYPSTCFAQIRSKNNTLRPYILDRSLWRKPEKGESTTLGIFSDSIFGGTFGKYLGIKTKNGTPEGT